MGAAGSGWLPSLPSALRDGAPARLQDAHGADALSAMEVTNAEAASGWVQAPLLNAVPGTQVGEQLARMLRSGSRLRLRAGVTSCNARFIVLTVDAGNAMLYVPDIMYDARHVNFQMSPMMFYA